MVFDKPTGIATYALNIAKQLSELNPTLLTGKEQDNLLHYKIPNNMTPAEGTRGHFRRLLWTQLELPKIYKKLNAGLVYSPIPEAPLYSKVRYVVMCHDLIPLRFPRYLSPLTNYFRYIVPSVLEQAETIICNSEATAKDITKYYKIVANKIHSIPLAYDQNNFYPRENKEQKILDRTPYFLYLGRHDFYKNIHSLIAAFADIKNNNDYELWIAGAPDKRFTPQLQKQVLELNIQNKVKFINYINYQDLPMIISNAIALVFPTLWEGFGLPVLEAMACGTPVITSNLASLPEITGDAAILINPYSVSEITLAMSEITENDQLRSQLSYLSLERAKMFSWEKTGKATKEVLEPYLNHF